MTTEVGGITPPAVPLITPVVGSKTSPEGKVPPVTAYGVPEVPGKGVMVTVWPGCHILGLLE